jgi:hypothetical protein
MRLRDVRDFVAQSGKSGGKAGCHWQATGPQRRTRRAGAAPVVQTSVSATSMLPRVALE